MSGDVFTLADLDRLMAKVRAAGIRPLRLFEETSMIQSIQLIIQGGEPIRADVHSLHVTCPQCTMMFSIDVANESSARADVVDYNKHVEAHGQRTKANDGIRDAVSK